MIENATNFVHEASFSEKLWFHGQKIGEVSGKFTLINLPFLSQMKFGVLKLRNNGISVSAKQNLIDISKLDVKHSKDKDNKD